MTKSLSVEETRHHILTPLRDNWSQVPELTAALLDGYISHQIAYVEGPTTQALEAWKEICNWVLDSSEIARKASYDYLDRDTGEVLQLIVFTQHGSSRIKDDWQHAHLFAEEEGQIILHYSQDEKLVLVEILDFRRFMSEEAVTAL